MSSVSLQISPRHFSPNRPASPSVSASLTEDPDTTIETSDNLRQQFRTLDQIFCIQSLLAFGDAISPEVIEGLQSSLAMAEKKLRELQNSETHAVPSKTSEENIDLSNNLLARTKTVESMNALVQRLRA